MFERQRVDNTQETTAVVVEIELTGGQIEQGKLMLPRGIALLQALNGTGAFLEFEPFLGEKRYISKAVIIRIAPLAGTRRPSIDARGGLDSYEPHKVLGIPADADWAAIRHAYVELTKRYHPDRYTSVALPAEIKTYLDAMVRYINIAYGVLEKAEAVRKRPAPAASAAGSPRY